MSYFTIGLILLLIMASSYYRRKARKTDQKVVLDDRFALVTPYRSGASGGFMRWWDRMRGRQQKKTPKEFIAWVESLEPSGNPMVTELKNWLATLEPKEIHQLMNQVAAFGAPFDFDLVWLLDGQVHSNLQLKQALEETVVWYCLANSNINLVADDIQAFIVFQAWQKDPNNKKQQQFSQQLFAKLVDEGLAAPAPADLFLASNKRRQKHAVEAIQEAAKQHPDAFNTALKVVVLSDKQPALTLQPAPVTV